MMVMVVFVVFGMFFFFEIDEFVQVYVWQVLYCDVGVLVVGEYFGQEVFQVWVDLVE